MSMKSGVTTGHRCTFRPYDAREFYIVFSREKNCILWSGKYSNLGVQVVDI
jgi:hypothetical protein